MKAKARGFSLVIICLAVTLAGLARQAPPPARSSDVTSSTQSPLQIAILHWYDANLTTSFSVGSAPTGVAFDGANIWVANFSSNSVSKLFDESRPLL